MKPAIIASTFALDACGATQCPPQPIKTVEVTRTVTVQRPCIVSIPERPAKLTSIPSDAVQLAAILAAKLAQFSAPGMYADQAEAALKRCQQP